jgi:hypothetical protein
MGHTLTASGEAPEATRYYSQMTEAQKADVLKVLSDLGVESEGAENVCNLGSFGFRHLLRFPLFSGPLRGEMFGVGPRCP